MIRRVTIPLTLLVATACGSAGDVRVTTWGEAFIEDRIPAEAFEDGWTVAFDSFLVSIGAFTLAQRTGDEGPTLPDFRLWDVTRPGPIEIGRIAGVPAEIWDATSFTIGPSASLAPGNATAEQVTRMQQQGWSVLVSGTATKGATTKRFEWGFATDTIYEHCRSDETGDGVSVPSGGEIDAQLTIHGDHLFFDDLQSPDAVMRFDPIAAADANDDDAITLEELAGVDLTSLPLGQYGTGNVADVRNLRDFVTALTRTLGHWNGEGECVPRAR